MAASAADHLVAPEPERALRAPAMVPVFDELARLANSYGVATEYFDQAGDLKQVSAVTVQAVLASLGVDASTPTSCAAALEERNLDHWRRMLPPVFVMRQHNNAETWVHVVDGDPVRVWMELDDGGYRHDVQQLENPTPPRLVDGRMIGEASFRIPSDLPLGWHTLHAESRGRRCSVPLVVSPERLVLPASLQERHGWGFALQLYAMRSSRSWGIGDLADLADLTSWSGYHLGADFIQINPLHAAEPIAPMAPSPYLPVTRRFVNPLYIRVEDIPEYAYLDDQDRERIHHLAEEFEAVNTSDALLDRDRSWAAKKEALELVSQVPLSPGREADYQAFLASEGEGLTDFATWCALVEVHGQDFEDWPIELRDPDEPAVRLARQKLADRVSFYCWVQWIVDSQLARCQEIALASGMRLGIMTDLAVGVHPHGADAWALQRVLASGACVGAPPDMYNQMGQNWSQPPWRPDTLAEEAFIPYRDMLRTVLRHAGALRLDHILGLFRLWWVPEGMPAYAGTYVKYDHEALLSILLLEAHRVGAVLIGEDLGTVERWVHELLEERGILGTTVLWFERTDDGGIRPAENWRRMSMVSVTVHDLPPTAAYLEGAHVNLRNDLNLLANPYDEEWAAYQAEVELWREHLTMRGLLRPNAGPREVVVALHRLAALSPCRLVAIAVPDTVEDLQSQNQPGTDQEYPNWRLPLSNAEGHSVGLEGVIASDLLRRLVAAVGG